MKFSKFAERFGRMDTNRIMDLDVVVTNDHLNQPAYVTSVEIDRTQGIVVFHTEGAWEVGAEAAETAPSDRDEEPTSEGAADPRATE